MFSGARMRDSFSDAICLKMGPSKFNRAKRVLKVLQEVIVYNPEKRLSATDAVKLIGDLNN